MAGGECKKRLRYCKPQRIWRRHHGRFGDGRVFDQYDFELEWADPIVGRFKDVIGASDIGKITVLIHRGDVAGAIDRLFGGSGGDSTALLPLIALHEPGWTRLQRQTDLAFLDLRAVEIKKRDAVSRQGPAHRAGFDLLPRAVASQGCRLGLPVAVADGDAPGILDAIDHL